MRPFATRIDGPIAVIGDVHGQVEKLVAVLDQLHRLPDFEQRWIVFIGDFVDRGPDPKGALDVFGELVARHPRTTAIAGNHEFAMAAALGLLPTPEYSNWAARWLDHYNAESTFHSYGVEFGELQELHAAVPEAHRKILADLPWCVEHPRHLFVHAGVDPNTPFEMQLRILRQKDFSLNRPQWLCSKSLVQADVPRDCPLTVVSGHVSFPQVQFRPKRILVDTTGGFSGDLSCVLLPEKKVITSGGAAFHETSAAENSPQSWWKLWK